MSPAQKSHYYPRADLHSLTAAVKELRQSGDVFITNVVGLDFYYPAVDFTYIDEANTSKLYDWSCRGGTIERWGNHPLIYRLDALGRQIQSSRRVLLAIDAKRYRSLQKRMAQWSPRVLWKSLDGDILIMTFGARGEGALQGVDDGTRKMEGGTTTG
jgi:hypothetical protein